MVWHRHAYKGQSHEGKSVHVSSPEGTKVESMYVRVRSQNSNKCTIKRDKDMTLCKSLILDSQ